MNVIFRTDASPLIGFGHAMRCLTLADALTDQASTCEFICREHDGNLKDLIARRGFKVHVLSGSVELEEHQLDLVHAKWLGAHWKIDATQTIHEIQDRFIDILIVDHYGIDYRWESQLRPFCNRIMVIDDLADRKHDCDFLLDQNLGKSPKNYIGLVAGSAKQYFGPKFALLNRKYSELRGISKVRDGRIRRALVYFGGGEESIQLVYATVAAFTSQELSDIHLDVVVSGLDKPNPHFKKLITERGKVALYQQLPSLADLMVKADLAVGAAGSTTWERCALGLPSILVVCAFNQEAIGKAIRDAGAGIILFPSKDLSNEILSAILKLKTQTQCYMKMSERAARICDGSGARRISSMLLNK